MKTVLGVGSSHVAICISSDYQYTKINDNNTILFIAYKKGQQVSTVISHGNSSTRSL